MGLPEPTTRSPGKLVLIYMSGGNQHLTGVRYLSGIAMPDDAQALIDATELANLVKVIMPNTNAITGYRITDPMGATILEGSFATAIAGTHAGGSGPSFSKTLSFTGKGTAIVSGERVGQTRMALYVYDAYTISAGEKSTSVSGDPLLAGIKTGLLASVRYWADYYGQKAIVRGLATVQYNAHAQRKLGS
jgi:hypothetical protein